MTAIHRIPRWGVVLHGVMLCLLIPLVAIAPNFPVQFHYIALLPAITIVYSGYRLARIAASGANRLLELTFWLYAYVFLGLSAFLQTAANLFPWPDSYNFDVVFRAHCLVLLGLVAFDLGYRGQLGIRARHLVEVARIRRVISRNHLYVATVVGLAVSAYATMELGGFETLFLNRTDRFNLISEHFDTAWMTIFAAFAKTVPYVLFIIIYAYRVKVQKQRMIFNAMLLFVGIWALVENNPIATARFQVGTLLLGGYFITAWSPTKVRFAIYSLLIGLVVIFPYADLYRTSNQVDLATRIHAFGDASPLAKKVDYDSFQQVVNGVRMVDRQGLRYGEQLLGVVFFWVPRNMWPDKAEPTGQLIGERSGYGFTNLSSPLWIELYVDGGWVWVFVGLALYGFGVRKLDMMRAMNTNTLTPIYIFATIFAAYQIYLLRGSLLPAIAFFSPVAPLVFFCTKRVRSWKSAKSDSHE